MSDFALHKRYVYSAFNVVLLICKHGWTCAPPRKPEVPLPPPPTPKFSLMGHPGTIESRCSSVKAAGPPEKRLADVASSWPTLGSRSLDKRGPRPTDHVLHPEIPLHKVANSPWPVRCGHIRVPQLAGQGEFATLWRGISGCRTWSVGRGPRLSKLRLPRVGHEEATSARRFSGGPAAFTELHLDSIVPGCPIKENLGVGGGGNGTSGFLGGAQVQPCLHIRSTTLNAE
uniref:Uncharacterized protein n=1 Tax=Micrurus corallinus TaxID=54390 RepID=A0A2D4GHZ5_MICCO